MHEMKKYIHIFNIDSLLSEVIPESKIHGANVGPTWGRQDPGGPHVGHANLAICDNLNYSNDIIDLA